MPTPTRLAAPLSLQDSGATMQPEPPEVQPKVSAASVWFSLFHAFGSGGFAGPLEWSISFGSYSAPTPATKNPDGSTTPQYQGVPTWLIEAKALNTAFGSCGITANAPFNANTGQSMGVEMTG